MLVGAESPQVDEFEEFSEEPWTKAELTSAKNAQYWTDDWDNEDPDFTEKVRSILSAP
jgi:hypothetical protein